MCRIGPVWSSILSQPKEFGRAQIFFFYLPLLFLFLWLTLTQNFHVQVHSWCKPKCRVSSLQRGSKSLMQGGIQDPSSAFSAGDFLKSLCDSGHCEKVAHDAVSWKTQGIRGGARERSEFKRIIPTRAAPEQGQSSSVLRPLPTSFCLAHVSSRLGCKSGLEIHRRHTAFVFKKKTVNKRMAPAVSVFHLRVRCCNAARQSFSGGTGHRGRGRNRSKRQACVSRLTAGDKNRINTPQHTLHLHHWFRNYWPRDIVLTGAHLL